MPLPLALILGGAAIGGLAGAMKDKSQTSYTSGLNMSPESMLELFGKGQLERGARGFEDMVNAGPGQSDITAGLGASRDLAAMLDQYSKGGYLPTDADRSTAGDLASKLFNPQRVAMGQAFEDQTTAANRQAALMGRSMNDPILRAKLAQEQTRQSALLEANQNAFATQFAMDSPLKRLGFASDRANVLGGLASQALANRQALASMGQGIMEGERNFRLQTAERHGTQNTESGGGLKGAINGGLAGAGTAMGLMNGFQSLTAPAGVGGGMGAMGAGSNIFNSGYQFGQFSFGQQPAGPSLLGAPSNAISAPQYMAPRAPAAISQPSVYNLSSRPDLGPGTGAPWMGGTMGAPATRPPAFWPR